MYKIDIFRREATNVFIIFPLLREKAAFFPYVKKQTARGGTVPRGAPDRYRVLLSPHGDMNLLHRLNEVLREKYFRFIQSAGPTADEDEFDYRYSFVVFGIAGIIRTWVSRNCPESPERMAEMAAQMILSGGFA